MDLELLRKKIDFLVGEANFSLRKDVRKLLEAALSLEKNKLAKRSLKWILENADIAREKKIALCQDTGLPVIFIEVGKDVELFSSLVRIIEKSVQDSYKKNYLRASLVDPLKRAKASYKGVSSHVEFNPRLKGIKITLFPKGFGSENKTRLKMFNPTVSQEEIEEFVVETVKQAGSKSCPPFVVGVGLGGTSDDCLLLAKKALIERIDRKNKDKQVSDLEESILKKINRLKIGPMGFGGKTTALSVKVKKAPTHIAGLPVGVNLSCWALRSASLNIKV